MMTIKTKNMRTITTKELSKSVSSPPCPLSLIASLTYELATRDKSIVKKKVMTSEAKPIQAKTIAGNIKSVLFYI